MNSLLRRFALFASASVPFCVLASGCGTGSSNASDGPEPSIHVTRVTSSSQIDLPVSRYFATAAETQAYFAAVNVAQKACSRRFGVETTIPVTSQPGQDELDSQRRFGVINRGEVDRYGYAPIPSANDGAAKSAGWNPTAVEEAVMNAQDASGKPVKTFAGRALPRGGCAADGFRKVWGGATPPQGEALTERILSDSWSLTMQDSRSLAAAKSWSACMGEAGYKFTHRWDAGNSVSSKPQSVKIAMAKQDLGCALKSNYVGVWYAVDKAYQDRLIDRNEGQLDAMLKDQQKMMGRAKSILGGGA